MCLSWRARASPASCVMLHDEAGFALTHRAWNTQGGLHYRGCDQQPDQQFPQLYVTLLSMGPIVLSKDLRRTHGHARRILHACMLAVFGHWRSVRGWWVAAGRLSGIWNCLSVRAPCHGFQHGWISFAAARLPELVALTGIEGCWIIDVSYHIMFSQRKCLFRCIAAEREFLMPCLQLR